MEIQSGSEIWPKCCKTWQKEILEINLLFNLIKAHCSSSTNLSPFPPPPPPPHPSISTDPRFLFRAIHFLAFVTKSLSFCIHLKANPAYYMQIYHALSLLSVTFN